MTITYRTTGLWGAGSGALLTPAQTDTNFYTLAQGIAALQAATAGNSIASVDVSGTTLTITMTNADVYAFPVPVATQIPAPVITIPGTALTPDLSHTNTYMRCTNAAGCAITIPDADTVPFITGTELSFRLVEADTELTLTADSGVTLNVPAGFLASASSAGSTITVKMVGVDEWDVFGLLDPDEA